MPAILEPPLVLVVEDEKTARELRVELFEESGFAAIGVPSKRDAERELRACPSIDLLVTDVNLDASKPSDKSGFELAKGVKATRPELPIIGYSGRLSANDVSAKEMAVFNDIHLKGRDPLSVMRSHLKEWREIAIKHRQSRIKRAAHELTRLQKRYSIDDYDFNLLREFIPAISQTGVLASSKSVEEVLNAAGFRLKIIEPKDVPEAVTTEGVQLASAIPIWLREADDHVLAEVYRFPDLYASGESEEEAIRLLLLLMAGYFEDLGSQPPETISTTLTDLKNYLTHVFR